MRLGLVADLHGNRVALETLLAALEREACDHVICLGDVAIFGPQPGLVLEAVQAAGWPVVMGNTDAWTLDPKPHAPRDDDTPIFNDIELWCAGQLTQAHLDFIRAFVPQYRLELPHNGELLCCHGSPRSYHDPILATTPDTELTQMLHGECPAVLACGHTHTPLLRRFGSTLIVNPGSVGAPFELEPKKQAARNPAWVEYGVLDASVDGVSMVFRRVAYAVEAVKASAFEGDMPHAAWWAERWA